MEPGQGASPLRPSPPRAQWGWLRVVLGGLLAAALLRTCAIEAYRIPSNSMERTLLVGDFVLVSKLAYGPRIGTWRGPGLGKVRCGDVIVFNHPPASGPVRARAPYIKRVAALPGESLEIRRGDVVVSGVPLAMPPEGMTLYDVRVDDGFVLPATTLYGTAQRSGDDRWVLSAPPDHGLAKLPGVRSVEPFVVPGGRGAGFPRGRRWGMDDYGPLRVPYAGWTIPLTNATATDYRTTIERHEGRTVDRYADGFRIDGEPAESYTFGQDYFFVLGDNRSASADSRTWGFVPMSHVIGRADRIYFSREVPNPHVSGATGDAVRWDRIGRRVERSCAASTERR